MKKALVLVLVLLVVGTLFIGGCATEEEDHHAGERCIVDADCPHEGDMCHGGFCEGPEEHEEHD